MTDGGFMGDQTTILGDLKSEDEKLAEALQIALSSMQEAKEDKKQSKAQDDEGMTSQTVVEQSAHQDTEASMM